ncbi:MAG: hypothetical protein IJJ43_08560 [Oscillospiraceae bacterium]|nr:hypothetical protein [Oscillospiraceae bacterium]
MRRLPRLICILLALALLAGCAAGEPEHPEPPERPVTLWLWSELPLSAALAALAEDYNAAAPVHPLRLRVFDSEDQMADAMNEERPDLLLCADERARTMDGQGKLLAAAPDAALAPALAALDESVGSRFFPLGADVPLLAVNASLYLASPVTDGVGEGALTHIDSLCSLAAAHGLSTEQPFFAAGSWAELFRLCLAREGGTLPESLAALAEDERAAALYNTLAEAAFDRGLYTGAEDAGELVRRGYVVCALLSSRSLARENAGLAFYPAPLAGDEALAPARLWGLAVTAGEDEALPGVNEFLGWLLQPERAAALALDEGLLPAVPWEAGEAAEGTLERALAETAASRMLVLPEADESRARRDADFDEALRAALALFD